MGRLTNTNSPRPPRWASWLLSNFTAPGTEDELTGDMQEMFVYWVKNVGLSYARWQYVLAVLRLIRPLAAVAARRKRRPKRSALFNEEFQTTYILQPAMFRNYLKIALRKLNRYKSYTMINVVSLSLGIACAVLIFTLVRYHLSFDTFHAKQDQIYRIYTEIHGDKIIYSTGVPNPLGEAFARDYDVEEKIGRIAFLKKRVVSVSPVKKFEEDVAFADADFLDIFKFPLLEGDAQTALRERNSALLTSRLAHLYFGDQNPIGKLLHIDGSLVVKITGVLKDLPANTDFRSEIFLPFDNLQDHSPWMVEKDWWMSVSKDMQCFVRLKPGITEASVNANLLPGISDKYYNEDGAKSFRFRLQPLSDVHFNPNLSGQTEKKNLWTFALIGFFLIVTACVNFVNLATAQALRRSQEIGVRKAVGGQRNALFWQFMTETALIATFATAVALALGYLAVPFVNKWFDTKLTLNPFSDVLLAGFVFLLLLIVTFFSGAYPGLVLARFQPVQALKGKFARQSAGGISVRKGLVVTQFAISQLLIIGTLIVTSQLRYSQQANLGFRKDAMIILPLPDNKPSKINPLATRIAGMAGVENVTFFDAPPAGDFAPSTSIIFNNRGKAENFSISTKSGDHRYISTFKIPILAGRNVNPSDTVREYLLNETAVKALGLSANHHVIGRPVTINGRKGTIVGVMKDFHFKSFRVAIEPLAVMTLGEVYSSCGVQVSLSNLGPTLSKLEKVWTSTYPSSIFTYRFLDDDIGRFYKQDTMLLRLIQGFAAIAIFVGCLGLYGLVSFMAAQKTKEIGVRKVLGASTSSILWLFGKEFSRLLLFAFLLAAPLAWWGMQKWLNNFVYRIDIDGGTFVLAIAITFIVAVVTVGFRSIKAALMDPVKTLRNE